MAGAIVQLATLIANDLTGDSNHDTLTRFGGFSVRESDGTPAVAAANFRHGGVGGQILAVLELAANESASFALPGMQSTPDGVYVEVVSGTISGVIYQVRE